jgi:membrane-bound inhibitor of C-type lysozyme
MTKKEIYKEVLNKMPDDMDWYSPSEGILCNDFWCYKCKDEVITLSNLQPKKRKLFWTNKQIKIKEDIKLSGFDYSKGHIVLTNDGDIVDGYHRFIALSENYHPSSTILVKRLTNLEFGELSVSLYFYLVVIVPLKSINLLMNFLVNKLRIISNLIG